MALTWVEDNESRSATIVRLGKRASSTYQKSYKLFGTTDDLVVHDEVSTRIANELTYWQYPNQPDVQLGVERYSVRYLGDDAWQVTIFYEKSGADGELPPPSGGGGGGGGDAPSVRIDSLRRSRSFDTSGGTQHITQAQGGKVSSTGTTTIRSGTERRFPANAPSMNSAIGVDGDSVAGVDIIVPALSWTETYDVPSLYVTPTYIRRVAALTGTTNDATFRGFNAGEVLFLGCSGNQDWNAERGDGPWSLSYKFVASPNVTGQEIGDIENVEKGGHEYLWVRYEDSVEGSDLVKKPKYVYVNTVYKEGAFSGLGIGS